MALILYFVFWSLYEISYELWACHNYLIKSDERLILLAVTTFCFNVFSVFLGVLLFYMVEKMTQPVQDEYYDPILKRHVPFFVYLANCKHVIEYINKGESLQFSGELDQRLRVSPPGSPPSELNSRMGTIETEENDNKESPPLPNSRLVRSTEPNIFAMNKLSTKSDSNLMDETNDDLALQKKLITSNSPKNHNYPDLVKSVAKMSSSTHSLKNSRRSNHRSVLLDRELYRAEDIYSKIKADSKYNAKTVKLAF